MVGMLGREQSALFIAQYLSAAQVNSSNVETSSASSTIWRSKLESTERRY